MKQDQDRYLQLAAKGVVSRIARTMRRLKKDVTANTLTIFAVSAVPIVGCIGVGLDVAQWVLWKRQLHSAADLAALAGASAQAKGHKVKEAVEGSLAENDQRDYRVIAIETPPTVGKHTDDTSAVRVLLQTQQALPFSSVFLPEPPVVDAEATALAASETSNCVISLDTSGNAIIMWGSSSVTMSCGMASNSNLDAFSADTMSLTALSAVGSVLANSNVDPQTKINSGIQPLPDPLASKVPEIDTSACGGASSISVRKRGLTLTPGCYTGISVNGPLTLEPGVYIIDGGSFDVAASASVIGEGVTIVMTSSLNCTGTCIGSFTSQGTSFLQLSAPTSGPYAGILFYQDQRAGIQSTTINYFRGNTGTDNAGNTINTSLEGALYSPGGQIVFTGNSSISTPCMQIVGKRVQFEGNTTIENNCPPGSGASAFGGTDILRLVE